MGSVGDIVSLVLLARDCASALSDSRGSASTYQAVVRELWVLEKALLEIDILCQTYSTAAELDTVREAARVVVDGCRKSLEAFKAKSQKYGPHLGNTNNGPSLGARNIVAGSAMKLLYAVSQKDEVARFRAEVVAYSVSINQILATATLHVLKTGQERIEQQLRAASAVTNTNVKDLQIRLKDVNSRIGHAGGIVAARLDWLSDLGKEIKETMQKLIVSNLSVLAAVVDLKKSVALLTSAATQSLNSEPKVIFEDALGRVYPITLQWITCWDMFDTILQMHFKDMQGSGKVARREYVLTNRATGRDLDLRKPLDRVFLPGQFIQMGMLFRWDFIVDPAVPDSDSGDTCPSCKAPSNQPKGLSIICSVCGLAYKRMTEVGSEDDNGPVQRPTVPDAPDSGLTVPTDFPRERSRGRTTTERSPIASSENTDDDDMSTFKRVTLITKKTLRRAQPQDVDAPWGLPSASRKKSKKKKKIRAKEVKGESKGEMQLTLTETEIQEVITADELDWAGISTRPKKSKRKKTLAKEVKEESKGEMQHTLARTESREATTTAEFAWASWATTPAKGKAKKQDGAPAKVTTKSPSPKWGSSSQFEYWNGYHDAQWSAQTGSSYPGPLYRPVSPPAYGHYTLYYNEHDRLLLPRYQSPSQAPPGYSARPRSRSRTRPLDQNSINSWNTPAPVPRPRSRGRSAASPTELWMYGVSNPRSSGRASSRTRHRPEEHAAADSMDYFFRATDYTLPPQTEARHSRRSSISRRSPSVLRSSSPRPTHHYPPPPQPRATHTDAMRAGIPLGYSLKNWDPRETPIILLGSVFDANTLGKWIFDWTYQLHGGGSPEADLASELWLLLIGVSGRLKRAEQAVPYMGNKEHYDLVMDFIESGDRVMTLRFNRLLKSCETYMLMSRGARGALSPAGMASVGADGAREFVGAMFGRDRELEFCQQWMQRARLWSARFMAHCEGIL